MATVHDVAAYILEKMAKLEPSGITTWKLQKLAYYSQAWSLVWDDVPLFGEPIEAWANGPVCPALYEQHRGEFKVSQLSLGNSSSLTVDQKDTVDKVIEHYAGKTSQQLSQLTHAEAPWIAARKGLAPGERGNHAIPYDSMAEYYGGLYDVQEMGKSTTVT
jgi:uncharacterized phage-associated protein